MAGHVAVVLLGIGPLVAGGGTERFFADVFARYRTWARRQHRITFVTDARTVRRLREVGRMTSVEGVEVLPGEPWGTAALAGSRALQRTIGRLGVDLIHIPLIAPHYLPYLWRRSAASARSPRLCISVVDANLAQGFFDRRARTGREQWMSVALHGLYFRTVRLDGIYTWYRAMQRAFEGHAFRGGPLVRVARCCYVNGDRFVPSPRKERRIVFAGRLVESKRPLLFVDGVRSVLRRAPGALDGWTIEMFGGGYLRERVTAYLRTCRLEERVSLRTAAEMAPEFATSRLFVSTQDRENVSSLAMLEAMACGNAVVARNVGQTSGMVRHGENGLLVERDDPEALAAAILEYVKHPEWHDRFGARSREIALHEHSEERFLEDIEGFWSGVLAR
jgi:glycosyltransferase involved in cell wall biosynthesis